MYHAGMLAPTAERNCGIDIFTVAKKVLRREEKAVQKLLSAPNAGVRPVWWPYWEVIMRMVFDDRRINVCFKRPPWASLGGLGALALVDLSSQYREGWTVGFVTGDIPDFYYRLLIPAWLLSFFTLDHVSLRDLRRALAQDGVELDWPSDSFIAVAGLGMGWSWAVYLSQMCLEDITTGAGEGLDWTRALIYGMSVPWLVASPGRDVLLWRYIDDYAAMVLEFRRRLSTKPLSDRTGDPVAESMELVRLSRPRLFEVYEDLRGAVHRAGLPVHKEECGEAVITLGMALTSDPPRMRGVEERFWLLYESTQFLLSLDQVEAPWVETTISMWTWYLSTLHRAGLSILDRSYVFCRELRTEGLVRLWESVKDELGALCGIAPFLEVQLALRWGRFAYMSDSSPSGYAVIRTEAEEEELQIESALAGYGGWSVEGDYEVATALEGHDPEIVDAVQKLPKVPLPRRLRVFRVGVFFCGVRSVQDIEDFLTDAVGRTGAMVLVDNHDLREGGRTMDFGLEANRQRELSRVQDGVYGLVVLRIPGVSWDRPSLREVDDPILVKPGASGRAVRQARSQSVLALFALQMACACIQRGSLFLILHRAPSAGVEEFRSPFWRIPEAKDVSRLAGISLHRMAGRKWGLENDVAWEALTNIEKMVGACRTPSSLLEEKEGRTSPLPLGLTCSLSRGLAVHLTSFVNLGKLVDLGEDMLHRMAVSTLGDLKESGFRKMRSPAVGSCWDPLGRWSVCIKGEWSFEEHNNIGEARSVVASLRHASRSRSLWNSRILLITDSLVTLGVFSKGRSSSRGMLRQSRVFASYQFGLGFRPVLRWVPSGRNWADGPSRRQKLGIAKSRRFQKVRVPGWAVA
jgi:hypothetical protein